MQTSKNLKHVFSYQGNDITFLNGEDVMVNATQMAKSFGKSPTHFLRNEQTASFISALRNRIPFDPVQVINGDKGGTWIHQKLALKFAAWLNPEFEIWIYDRIEELLKHGATALAPEDLLNPDYVIQVMTALKQEREEKRQLQVQTEIQAQELVASAPKVQYYDKVMQSESLISVTQLANELGFSSAKALNKFLNANKIIRRVNNSWTLTSDYSGKGFAKYKPHVYTDSQGRQQTANHMYFTERGRKMLHEKLNQAN